MVYIAYFTELNLQICEYAQKRSICRENCKYAVAKIIMNIFAPDEWLPISATLPRKQFFWVWFLDALDGIVLALQYFSTKCHK